jgi:xanthine dehydrogenase YagR molybdenum-binding subunit
MPDTIIGQPIDRIDGKAKVTGAARYAADWRAEHPAFGVIVTSTIGRGAITRVDTKAAEEAPGVVLVMSNENAPAQAPFRQEGEDRHARPKPQLAEARVHFHGEPVALVVADTFEQATAAARLVKVSYQAEAGLFDLGSGRKLAYPPAKMVGGKADSKVGDIARGLAQGAAQIDATYTTPYQSHNPMEPPATLAAWTGNRLTICCATQLVDSTHHSIASTLRIPLENVEVVSEFIGGGFGGKLPIYADAILAATNTRRPPPPAPAPCMPRPTGSPPIVSCRSTCPSPIRCARRAMRSASSRSSRRWTSLPTGSISTRSSSGCATSRPRIRKSTCLSPPVRWWSASRPARRGSAGSSARACPAR